MNAADYRSVILVACPDGRPRVSLVVLADADLAVCDNGQVIKDRYGRTRMDKDALAIARKQGKNLT